MANEMLADTTIAGQEGVIEYVANSAALQQFEQTSLAYLMLGRSDKPLDTEGLCSAVEELLEKEFQVCSSMACSPQLNLLKSQSMGLLILTNPPALPGIDASARVQSFEVILPCKCSKRMGSQNCAVGIGSMLVLCGR